MTNELLDLLTIDEIAMFDRQARRKGDGDAARVVQVVEFMPGEPTPDVMWIHDPIPDAVDDFLAELEATA